MVFGWSMSLTSPVCVVLNVVYGKYEISYSSDTLSTTVLLVKPNEHFISTACQITFSAEEEWTSSLREKNNVLVGFKKVRSISSPHSQHNSYEDSCKSEVHETYRDWRGLDTWHRKKELSLYSARTCVLRLQWNLSLGFEVFSEDTYELSWMLRK